MRRLTARYQRLLGRLRARLWSLRPGVKVGPNVRIGKHCRLIIDDGARLWLGEGCEVDDGTTLAVYGRGKLVLGKGVFLGHHCTIAAGGSVDVGDGTFLAELVSIRDHDHEPGAPPSSFASVVSTVRVGRDVWLGAKVTVLRGATIGDGAVVGANAVVRGDLPARVVAVGMPARVIRSLDGHPGAGAK